ncbi:MAG: ABC-2 family transporter protein [Polyangiaceae bacterium]|nr:ABC-2 family transporter protein [Polyangiaceae bacterium]
MRSGTSRALRALPTLFRVGVAETVAYRAEFLVWLLTSTLPLVMLGLWTSVAGEGPFRGYASPDFVAYYLATLVVRNLTGSWVSWQVSEEVRTGALAMRLLRPVHPFVALGASHLAAVPFRTIVALPIALVLLASSGASALSGDPGQLLCVLPSVALAWLVTFATLFTIGSLAFFITKSMAIANLYFGLFSLLSGYLLPLPLLPRWVATVAELTPFPAMLTTPVELLTRTLSGADLARLLGVQLGWAAATVLVALTVWRLGVRRFEAVGG